MCHDLDPLPLPERSLSVVYMELVNVANEIQTIEMRLDYLKSLQCDLQNELQSLQTSVTERSYRNIENEKKYKADFVFKEILGDVIEL